MTAEPPSLELAFDLSMRRAGTEFRFAAALSEPVTAVIGRSGSGKTTLARLLAGFERPEAGFLSIGGADVVRVDEGVLEPPERRGIGFVFQTHRVFPHLTVRENLGFAVRRCARPSAARSFRPSGSSSLTSPSRASIRSCARRCSTASESSPGSSMFR